MLALTGSLLLGITVLPVVLAGGDSQPPTACGVPPASTDVVNDTSGSVASDTSVAARVPDPTGCFGSGIIPLDGGWSLPGPRYLIDRNPRALGYPHEGYPAWDWIIREGTPIYAVRGGRVAVVRTWPYNWWNQGCGAAGLNGCETCGIGLAVVDEQGTVWNYCHGSDILVQVGDIVRAGQQILLSGNTGRSGTPHLHIEIRVDGVQRCPQPLLRSLYEYLIGIDPTTLPIDGCSF